MNFQRIGDGFRSASRRPRPAQCDSAHRPHQAPGAPSAPRARRRRDPQSGYAFIFALGLILLMIASSLVVLQKGATIRHRQLEQETIWRGNQYVRAIRLYYHKTGRYPQTLDDLQKGLPDLHFLRQPYKNPTNPADGSWRFIYVNAAGQIIGSTRYANLQQMALMDANGGQLPTPPQGQPGQPAQPGQPGVPVSNLTDSSGLSGTQPPQNPAPSTGTDTSNGSAPSNGGPDVAPPPSQDDQNSQNANGQNSQTQQTTQNPQNPQNPSANPSGQNPLPNGLGQAGGLPAMNVDPATLAAMALLKPTGPVDGPVLGAFLTGVACTQDANSQKVYHGGKKYINWEFIWNPLEDAAAAMQQQLGGASTGSLGQAATGAFGGGLGGANPGQQNNSPGSNPFQQQPQQPQQPQQQQPPQ